MSYYTYTDHSGIYDEIDLDLTDGIVDTEGNFIELADEDNPFNCEEFVPCDWSDTEIEEETPLLKKMLNQLPTETPTPAPKYSAEFLMEIDNYGVSPSGEPIPDSEYHFEFPSKDYTQGEF